MEEGCSWLSSRTWGLLRAVGLWGHCLAGGLHSLHTLLQAAIGENHVVGVSESRTLPLVLLAVPDAIAEIDHESCRGSRSLRTRAQPHPCGPPPGSQPGSHSPISSQMEKRSQVR